MLLLKPKEIVLHDMEEQPFVVILSRFPATIGREIATKYPMANMPKIGDYKTSDEIMEKLMRHVAVPSKTEGADPIILQTRGLIDGHIPDAETLMKIEMAMLEYNFSFFRKGAISNFFNEFVQMISAKITEMLIQSSAPSSPPDAPRYTSSEPSTTSKMPS